ncbi:MAG TPA: C40 family peptidase [Balneolales bacterium]|nr:C40 family peptidase [Balneolales bacterium]
MKNDSFCYAYSGIVPLRKDHTDASEMVTQMLLGETAKVLNITERWVEVTCDFDDYSGWVNKNQVRFLTQTEFEQWTNDTRRNPSAYYNFFIESSGAELFVPVGASVIIEGENVILPDGRYSLNTKPNQLKQRDLLDTARQFLGVPYLWGGRTDSGIDCSGFIQTVYSLHGYKLPRDSRDQAHVAKIETDNIDLANRGDIIYFNTTGEHINHVGFYIGEGLLLHASGNVKINNIRHDRRNGNQYPFDNRLAEHIYGIQNGQLLRKFAKTDQFE